MYNSYQRGDKVKQIIIVGNFAGEDPLAAVGACGVPVMAFLALANGFSAGVCVLISQLFGVGETEQMRRQAGFLIYSAYARNGNCRDLCRHFYERLCVEIHFGYARRSA